VSVDKQETSTESRLQWLDEELRQAKAALHKVEHELEQALNQIWNLDSGLRKLDEGSGDSGGTAAALPGIQEEIRQLRSQADKLQDRQNALAGRSEELGRQQQADLERERQERAALLKQAEAAARSVGQFESRIQLLEESLRHVEESVAELRLSHQTLTREIEELTNRSARNLETALRLEHQAAGLAGEIEALQKRDGEIEDRVNLFEERIHRSEERVDKFEQHLSSSSTSAFPSTSRSSSTAAASSASSSPNGWGSWSPPPGSWWSAPPSSSRAWRGWTSGRRARRAASWR